jgi:hypothetical protein
MLRRGGWFAKHPMEMRRRLTDRQATRRGRELRPDRRPPRDPQGHPTPPSRRCPPFHKPLRADPIARRNDWPPISLSGRSTNFGHRNAFGAGQASTPRRPPSRSGGHKARVDLVQSIFLKKRHAGSTAGGLWKIHSSSPTFSGKPCWRRPRPQMQETFWICSDHASGFSRHGPHGALEVIHPIIVSRLR